MKVTLTLFLLSLGTLSHSVQGASSSLLKHSLTPNPNADFTWVFSNNGSAIELMLTPLTNASHFSHTWILEKKINGQWTEVSRQENLPSGTSFTGLNTMSDYRMSHLMYWNTEAIATAILPENYVTTDSLFTGGKIFKGISRSPIFKTSY